MNAWSLGFRRPVARWAWCAVVFAVAVLLRLAFLREVRELPTYQFLQSDELAAHQAGVACMEGRLPSDAYLKAPVYVYFIGCIYKLFGPNPDTARIIQAILCSFSAVWVLLIAERLFGWVAGLMAGWIGAVFWMFVFYTMELVDASLATFFYLILAYTLVVADHRMWWHWLLAGVFMGLGAVTRPNVLLFAPVLATALFVITWRQFRGACTSEQGHDAGSGSQPLHDSKESTGLSGITGQSVSPSVGMPAPASEPNPSIAVLRRSSFRQSIANVVALTAGCCAIIAPVTIRNRVVGGEWVLIAAYGGLNLWVGNNPDSDGKNVVYMVGRGAMEAAPINPNDVWSDALGDRVARAYAERTAGRPLRRGELDRFYYHLAMQYIGDNPRKFIVDTLKRTCYLFNAYEFATVRDPYQLKRHSRVLNALSYIHFGILCPFLMLGIVACLRAKDRPHGATYNLLMLASMMVGGALFVVNSRFRMPLVFLGVPFIALGFIETLGLLGKGVPWSRRLRDGCVLAGVGLLSNWDVLGYRPPYHTDLRFAELVACWTAKRTDLMPEACQMFEEALERDRASGSRTWSTLIAHAGPSTVLFACYGVLCNPEKTLQYGERMSYEDSFDPDMGAAFFDVLCKMDPDRGKTLLTSLIKKDRRDAAALLLKTLGPCLSDFDALMLTFQYAERFRDVDVLLKAKQMAEDLKRRRPQEAYFRELHEQIRRQLADLSTGTQPTSHPATPSTRGSGSNGG